MVFAYDPWYGMRPRFSIAEYPEFAADWRSHQCSTSNVYYQEDNNGVRGNRMFVFPKAGTDNTYNHNPYPDSTGKRCVAAYTARYETANKANIPQICAAQNTAAATEYAKRKLLHFSTANAPANEDPTCAASLMTPYDYGLTDGLNKWTYADQSNFPGLTWTTLPSDAHVRPVIPLVTTNTAYSPAHDLTALYVANYSTSYRIDMVTYALVLFDSYLFNRNTGQARKFDFFKTDIDNYIRYDNIMLGQYSHCAPFRFSSLMTTQAQSSADTYDNQVNWTPSGSDHPKGAIPYGFRESGYIQGGTIQGTYPHCQYLGEYTFGNIPQQDAPQTIQEKYAMVLLTDTLTNFQYELERGRVMTGISIARISVPFINCGFISNHLGSYGMGGSTGCLPRGIYILEMGCEVFFTPM